MQPFKCGPDYIDPAFHTRAAGRPSYNLDTWAMSRGLTDRLLDAGGQGADIAIAEGAMGLFDGVARGGQAGSGASADVAALTGWPVLLVLDVSGQAETAAAVALGCASYRTDIKLAGVVLNRVASDRHLSLIQAGFERVGIPVVGAIKRHDSLALPERHLGLVQAGETADLERRLDQLADVAAAQLDLDAILAAAVQGRSSNSPHVPAQRSDLRPPGQRIAIAQDAAFTFLYPHLVLQWREAGADITTFSPLADDVPAADCDAVWLPGGYPELHAGALAGNARFMSGLRACAERNVPIHGECGGYMVLGHGLVDADGVRHAMVGLLALETSFAKRKLSLGYRRATLTADCVLGTAGLQLSGHEFHYATTLSTRDEVLAVCHDAQGRPVSEGGSRRGSVTGTFFHVIDRVSE